VYVRAINEDGHYLGLEEKLVVCVTSLEDVLPKNTLYLYDLMGRIVDVQASDILRDWSVPTSGIYIIRSINKYQQVYIK
jgi:ABC-type phosphate transport system auxiliary subunit